jgi:GR25 family glycosyltransferase involved in LPS biosynthesis
LFDGPASFHDTVSADPKKYKQWLTKTEDVFPLVEANFYDVRVKVPKNPENILLQLYGEDCLKVARVKIGDVPGTNENLKEKEITEFVPGKLLNTHTITPQPNEEYGIYRCFVVNLQWQHDRLHHAMEECDRYSIPAERVVAVQGFEVPKDVPIDNSKYKFRKNEIACYLSHVKAIQRISEMPDGSRCIVFEDDIKFRPDFPQVMKKVKEELDRIDWDVVFLGLTLYEKAEISPVSENLAVFGLATGAWAYMLTPKSARKILEKIFPITHPIDLVITVPNPMFPTDKNYDDRFENELQNFVVYTGECYESPNSRCRYGIVDELSTAWGNSTSSQP